MVLVLDKRQKPLMPGTEKRARLLLERRRAVVYTMAPFTIRMTDRTAEASRFQPLQAKVDPGSKQTGVAIRLDGAQGSQAIFFRIVVHRTNLKARREPLYMIKLPISAEVPATKDPNFFPRCGTALAVRLLAYRVNGLSVVDTLRTVEINTPQSVYSHGKGDYSDGVGRDLERESGFIHSLLNETLAIQFGIANKTSLNQLVHRASLGHLDDWGDLAKWLSLELWLRQFDRAFMDCFTHGV